MRTKKVLKRIILPIIILIVVLCAAYFVLSHVSTASLAVAEPFNREHWGSLSGSVGYPSESIPPMGVCAKSVEGSDMYCTYILIQGTQYQNGHGYTLSVPPGTYNVFAHLITSGNKKIGYVNEAKAYFSEFVTCGQLLTCLSHTPIPVEVKRNQNLENINPVDWYL